MYADIIVDISHDKLDRTFQYIVPDTLIDTLEVGMQVIIPFGSGNRLISGYIVGLTDTAEYDIARMKYVDSIADNQVCIENRMIKLASFMRKNYGGSMNQALKTVIPVKESMKHAAKKSVSLKISKEMATSLSEEFQKKRAVAKKRLIDALIEEEVIEYSLLTSKLNISSTMIKDFQEKGYVSVDSEEYYRNPVGHRTKSDVTYELTQTQKEIAKTIIDDYDNGIKKTCLIKGITGSGKTEIYMSVIDHVIKMGKQVIVLIPEISLTFQTVMRFYSRFGDTVTVMNSRLSKGERYDQYIRAKKGLVNIIIGPRSALFTPFENLGLIVIDEEHEGAYKSDTVPRYHAVGVARELARLTDSLLLLGSATPSMESNYKAINGDYRLFSLNERALNSAELPKVYIVDLKDELKNGNKSVFSTKLKELITDRLEKKQQIMLFINRRGFFGFVSCRACGHAMKCPHCDISLTYHKNGKLRCHYCGHTENMVNACPKCGSKYISTLRGGTQMVEDSLKKEFPTARVLRMDTDTTSTKDGHEKILAAFASREADILVGTQMIVKGHDFSNVTLMGVLAADISLHASDYRATERTFQILTQAAGRAGRGDIPGEVVIQAYDTENFAIETAAAQNYDAFYENEIMYRTLLGYPPVANMLLVKFLSKYENRLIKAVDTVKINMDDVMVIGPSDASLYKADDIYNKVIYYKTRDYERLTQVKDMIEKFVFENPDFKYVSVQFDFNPLNS